MSKVNRKRCAADFKSLDDTKIVRNYSDKH
ncbi:hypothetical protein S1001342_03159 (plasmid) [Acetobacter pasteurianus subsp. pasteurianus]|uniref:Uncharacterized protein n=1 Tax=Acetobacter pasteurianus subsp. pasteurianus TaxID=481145 RepID=A0A1Y0Y2L9_ACEPA|nr:hypothetical protein S1001342_03159 [Acetobacter pasteurianus subsp. pasteurianus]